MNTFLGAVGITVLIGIAYSPILWTIWCQLEERDRRGK